MTVRALDNAGDIVTSGNQFLATGSAEEVAQNVRTRLRFYLGEWFLDTRIGTPWFDSDNVKGILGKGGSLSQKESAIKREILQAPGLSRMTEFKMDYDLQTRALSVQTSIISKSGETTDVEFIQVI